MKRQIRLTEAQLHRVISESVQNILNEELEESWLGDKWNQTKSAVGTAFQGNGDMGMTDRINGFKKNWNTQGELNGLKNLSRQLSQFVDDGQLDPQMTIAQLIGGKYNNNKFGRMSGMAANRMGQISRRGGTFY
jgi:hypothetical protein